ncbi:MAG: maleylacetoacetate isomerase [Rickettsiales bacterium]
MKLHTYFQSSASYRVRIAMNLKGIAAEYAYHDLSKDKHLDADYAKINPQKMVPSLEVKDEVLAQSIAIMEYLEEVYPNPAILPKEPLARAHARAIALLIAGDISAINNLKIRKFLKAHFGASDHFVKTQWIQHWIADGFTALEGFLTRSPHTGTYCAGEYPTIADCCLVPQMFNARRFELDLTPYPTIVRISNACEQLEAFKKAHPSQQADAV